MREDTLRLRQSVLGVAAKRLLYGRFHALKENTRGLLPLAVYKHLYRRVKVLPDYDIVEIGGAAGTASIAMAWAMADSDKKARLVVVEKCEGGTRAAFGGWAANLSRLERNLASYGVRDRIVLYPHHISKDNGSEILRLTTTPGLAGFVSDADGRIHRDFALFAANLVPEAMIVIDDYHPTKSWKHAMTYRLLNQLNAWGLFAFNEQVKDTVFGSLPTGADLQKLDYERCESIVASVLREYGSD